MLVSVSFWFNNFDAWILSKYKEQRVPRITGKAYVPTYLYEGCVDTNVSTFTTLQKMAAQAR